MKTKNTSLPIGLAIYLVASILISIFAGRIFYNYFHLPDTDFSWFQVILAISFGWFLAIILFVPAIRYTLPRCPECSSGRLKSSEELLDVIIRPAGIDQQGRVKPETEILKKQSTWACDRCSYADRKIFEYPVAEN